MDDAAQFASRTPRRRPAGGTIGSRVGRILALPALVVLLLLALVASGLIQQFRDSQSTSRSVTLALAVQDLVHELQTERGVTAAVLGGNGSFVEELAPSRTRVDRQRRAVADLVDGGSDRDVQVRTTLQQLDGLPAVRAATDDEGAGRAATFDYYTDRIAELSEVDGALDNASDAELRRGVAALRALQDFAEATAQERALLNGVFSAGGFAPQEFLQFAAMRADAQAALRRFDAVATPDQREARDFVLSTGAATTTSDFERVALDAADGRRIVVNPQSWWSGLTTVLDDLTQLQEHVGSQIRIEAHQRQTGAAWQIGGLAGAVLLCLAGSLYLAALASRSITRPLAALAAEAGSVATERLPEAVRRVQANDADAPPRPPPPVAVPARATREIHSVASALDRLQGAAYELATEQALQRRDTIESMANLGRRNQNLIRRQLGFITSLEREEMDPDALSNLFELDHLATRMRRNAASLLVLVGASSQRQWTDSVPVSDVIRAAVSEVEEYRRVSLRRIDDVLITGSAIGAVAHLLSELIENGLTFSPPDVDVEVQGRLLPDGYLIAITDQGVGMSAEELREANSRLRGEGDFIAAPTRFLGHFVVGKLARETDVSVELLPSPVTGVTARVILPGSLVSGRTALEAPALSGTRPRHVGHLRKRPAPTSTAARPQLTETAAPDPAASAPVSAPVSAPAPRPDPDLDLDATPGAGIPIVPGTAPETATANGASKDVVVGRTVDHDATDPHGFPVVHVTAGSTTRTPDPDPPTSVDLRDPAPAEPGPERTANGLPKRTPRRTRSNDHPPRAPQRVVDLDAAERASAARPKDSPVDVATRLTALRSGLQRGREAQLTGAARPGSHEHETEDEA